VQLTVFEETFSAMGTIPFIGWSFNEVLPPVMLGLFTFTCKSPSFLHTDAHVCMDADVCIDAHVWMRAFGSYVVHDFVHMRA